MTQDLRLVREVVLVESLAQAGPVVIRGTVSSPAVVADLRDADCRADVRTAETAGTGIGASTHLDVVVFASGSDCRLLRQGSTVRVRGDAGASPFDALELWIRIGSGGVSVESEPDSLRSVVGRLHNRFFDVTERLSDQGRILVPGLTIGMTGADRADPGSDDAGSESIDPAYAALVEQGFSDGGIMHLMAVSGGHFLLLTGMVTRLCRRLLAPRGLTAVLCAASCLVLALMMAPSDSVTRALCAGMLSAAALAIGRPSRPCSATCWTAVTVIILDPGMARSIGFALSCAAVLGIVLAAGPCRRLMEPVLGRHVAAALAVTLAAQIAALPIQTLLEPGIPLWAPLVNLLVTPVVGVSTVLGLVAMTISAVSVTVAFPFAWAASCGTAVMASAVGLLDGAPLVIIPWIPGPVGAAVLGAVSVFAVLGVRHVDSTNARRAGTTPNHVIRLPRAPVRPRRSGRTVPLSDVLRRRADDPAGIDAEAIGRAFVRSPSDVLGRWMRDTRELIEGCGESGMSTDGKRLKGWHDGNRRR